MAEKRVIEVPLPEGVEPTSDERRRLEAMFRAILELRYEGSDGQTVVRRLEEAGWSVRWELGWIAEARRGREFERASGRTRGEALAELETLAKLDMVSGYS